MDGKNEENTNKNKSSNNEEENEQQPTTSRNVLSRPEKVSHNMNDLKVLDFNSADDVRQKIKRALLSGEKPPYCFNEAADNKGDGCRNGLKNVDNKNEKVAHYTGDLRNTNMLTCATSMSGEGNSITRRLKRGRPPKAGPSKKFKKDNVKAMYNGKLSNLISYRRRRESDIYLL